MQIRAFTSIALILAGLSARGEERIRFNQDIRPILSQKCFQCLGPDEPTRKAKLRLDRADGEEGALRVHEGSRALKAGDLENSTLWARINTTDADEVMPPPKAHKGAVSSREKALIKQWILEGAEYEEFWAFVPPRPQDVPLPENTAWSPQPIDLFVMGRLEAEKLEPSPPATKRDLIRRLSFDLTGLPPTLPEIQAFLDDTSEDAYPRLVDRLMARPQYGEHMSRYWLDLVRFADTNGLHHDHYREMTPYRDWVIRAFNDNLDFDQFIKWQVAGDLFAEPSVDQQIASGFNRLHLIIDRGTALPEESFTRNVIDRVSAVGTAFLGLTVQCAVCHDHKYDPISQKEFYQLYAFFNNFDGAPETGGRGGSDFKRGLQPPYINLPSPEQDIRLKEIDADIARLDAQLKARKTTPKVPDADEVKPLTDELARRRKDREKLVEKVPAALVMKERAEVRPAHLLIRGAYDQPGERVERDTPAFLPPMKKSEGLRTRMDLAEWLVDPSHPLTARVTVNRFWQQFFGVGLVKTSEDFGAQGEWPSHPGLLDHLTIRFVESGWDVKNLVRSIVLSETYRQSSAAERNRYLDDPDNRLLSRGSRFRLDAEVIRDEVLAVTGLLNPEVFGKSVKPPQPADLWKTVAMPGSYPRVFVADTGDQIYRRSIYTFWKRALPPPQMSIFDAPTRESCIARRERTNTPLQALLMMNEEQYFQAARHCARELLRETTLDDAGKIRQAYELITSQLPDPIAMRSMRDGLHGFRQMFAGDADSARAMTSGIPDLDSAAEAELAAWTMLVHSLLNLDVTRTRQ